METDVHFARLLADLPEALVCDEAFLGELAKNAKLISVKKGDYLLRTGELCQDAYFINKGLFINLYVNENGNECVTGFAADNMLPSNLLNLRLRRLKPASCSAFPAIISRAFRSVILCLHLIIRISC